MSALALALLATFSAGALPEAPVPSTAGPLSLAREAEGHPFTVVYFFSRACPVVRAHDERLLALVQAFAERGVRFLLVDAQAGATLDEARASAAARGYPAEAPLAVDEDSTWADALGVRYSATVVILERGGAVRYRGGFDTDRSRLSDDAVPLARQALEALLAGQAPPKAETKALGCVLRRK